MSQTQKLRDLLALKKVNTKVWCRLGVSKVHGVGIFALKDIPKGTDPFVDSYMGDEFCLIDKRKFQDSPKEVKDMLEDYWPTNDNKNAIVPVYPNVLVWTNYLNYTQNDNEVNIYLNDKGKWETTKDIKKGEELLENPNHHFNEDGSFKIRQVIHRHYLSFKN
jgi:hypothetical protein